MAATCSSHPIPAPKAPALIRTLFAVALIGMRKLARALKNRRKAGKLAGLDDRMLADIGLTRSDLRDAYAEPLWRDPTDILANRACEKRAHRTKGVGAVVMAPPLAPGQAFLPPRIDRPARHII